MKRFSKLILNLFFCGCGVCAVAADHCDLRLSQNECAIDELVTESCDLPPSQDREWAACLCCLLSARLVLIDRVLRSAAWTENPRLAEAVRNHRVSRAEASLAALSGAFGELDLFVQADPNFLNLLETKRVYQYLFANCPSTAGLLQNCPSLSGCSSGSFSVRGLLNMLRAIYTRLLELQVEINERILGEPETWVPISAADMPYTITEPGVYRLIEGAESIAASPIITVDSPGVLLDLAGHTLEDFGTIRNQIGIAIRVSNVMAKDGRIRNCSTGVLVDESTTDIHSVDLRKLRISGCETAVWCKGLSQGYIHDLLCSSNLEGIVITTDAAESVQEVQDIIVEKNQVSGSTAGNGYTFSLVESLVEAGPVVILDNMAIDNAGAGFYVAQGESSKDVLLKSNIATSHSLSDGYEIIGSAAGTALVNNYASENQVHFDFQGVVDEFTGADAQGWQFWENLSLL